MYARSVFAPVRNSAAARPHAEMRPQSAQERTEMRPRQKVSNMIYHPLRQNKPTGVISFMKRRFLALWSAVTAAVIAAAALCLCALALTSPVQRETAAASAGTPDGTEYAVFLPDDGTPGGGTQTPEAAVRLPIVMYHHISPIEKIWGKYVVSVDEFERDLQYLRSEGYESVSVRQLLDWSEGRFTMPEKPCMITFDDGYETTGEYAAPLLEKYGFTGVVAVIGSVAQQYSETPDHNLQYSHLSWERIAELSRGGVLEVQCHTWEMHELSPRKGMNRRRGEDAWSYRAALEKDLQKYADACAACGVETVPAVAYPFGAYCEATCEAVRELGFRAGFTCTERVNVLTGAADGLMELGRYNRAHGASSEAFFAKWEAD